MKCSLLVLAALLVQFYGTEGKHWVLIVAGGKGTYPEVHTSFYPAPTLNDVLETHLVQALHSLFLFLLPCLLHLPSLPTVYKCWVAFLGHLVQPMVTRVPHMLPGFVPAPDHQQGEYIRGALG